MKNEVKKTAIQFEELSNDAQGQLTGGFNFIGSSPSVAVAGTNNCSCSISKPVVIKVNVNAAWGCGCKS